MEHNLLLTAIRRGERLVHLDLKGAPPKISYFETFFPFIKNFGATGVLIEWEDTFPFTNELLQIGSLSDNHSNDVRPYNVDEAQQLLNLALNNDLNVIPLIQTYSGHMEYILKHQQWQHLREIALYPNSVCPTHCGTMPLIRNMIEQIVTFHKSCKYIHIGGDEVWHMGACPACSNRIKHHNNGKHHLYIEFIAEIARFIKNTYPYLTILMWDDMLRNIDVNVLKDANLAHYDIVPVIWHYNSAETFNNNVINCILEKYNAIFDSIWMGTAFKGATTSCQILPIIKYHISNHQAWLNILLLLLSTANLIRNPFVGVIITGWSRYDHYATLCELLPCGVPSLCFCLTTWLCGGYNDDIHTSVSGTLGYNDGTTLALAPQLTFPGWQIFVGFEWYASVETKYKNIVDSDQVKTWANRWQIANNYTNPMQIHAILPAIIECLNELMAVELYLKAHLEQIFYLHTIDELVGTLIMPLKQRLNRLKDDCGAQLSIGGQN